MTVNVNIELDPRVELKARRTLDGNIMIFDHEDMDIVLMMEKKKCVTFPKNEFSDKSYVAQDRMMSFLAKKGLIDRGSVVEGNVFGSLEAKMLESKFTGIDQTQALLFSIEEYITGEKKFFRQSAEFDDARLDAMLRPAPEDSTELGDVEQAPNKGSMNARVRPYGFQYNYSLVREGESEDQ
jgi:hypothetical protein